MNCLLFQYTGCLELLITELNSIRWLHPNLISWYHFLPPSCPTCILGNPVRRTDVITVVQSLERLKRSIKEPAVKAQQKESHFHSITTEPACPEDKRAVPRIPRPAFTSHERTCRWGTSCSWEATAITPGDLSTLVAKQGQLLGTSRHVVMLMVMDALSVLRYSVLCRRSEWRRGQSSETPH